MNNKITKIVAAIVVLIMALVFIFLVIPKKDKEESTNKISNISINGIKLGDTANKKMKQLVEDASFTYEYNNVGFDVDKNDKITLLYFLRYENTDEVYDITKAKVYYNKTRLTTVKDFDKILGEGKITKENNGYKTKVYTEDNLSLELFIKDDNIINIKIELNEQ